MLYSGIFVPQWKLGMRGSRVGTGGPYTPPPLKYQRNIGFLAILDRIPCNFQNFQSYQASIQCWANTGPPAKRHLSSSARQGNLMAFRWRAGDGPLLVVFGFSLPLKTLSDVQSWTPSDKTFWIRAC